MLRHLSSRDDDLSARNVVIWQEYNLQQVSNFVITVNLLGYSGNELNNGFGVVISRSGLSSDADDSWHEFALSLVSWGIENTKISVNDVKDVHELSLVLMNSLNLDVIHSINWDIVSSLGLDPCSQSFLVLDFDCNELILELLVSGIWHQVSQVIEGSDPLIDSSEGLTDEIGESWVAAMNPSSWSDSVGLVLEFTWIKSIEFTENGILKELRMESSDTVNGVGANNGKIGHSNLLWISFLDE